MQSTSRRQSRIPSCLGWRDRASSGGALRCSAMPCSAADPDGIRNPGSVRCLEKRCVVTGPGLDTLTHTSSGRRGHQQVHLRLRYCANFHHKEQLSCVIGRRRRVIITLAASMNMTCPELYIPRATIRNTWAKWFTSQVVIGHPRARIRVKCGISRPHGGPSLVVLNILVLHEIKIS